MFEFFTCLKTIFDEDTLLMFSEDRFGGKVEGYCILQQNGRGGFTVAIDEEDVDWMLDLYPELKLVNLKNSF